MRNILTYYKVCIAVSIVSILAMILISISFSYYWSYYHIWPTQKMNESLYIRAAVQDESYDALILGTSMLRNAKCSDLDSCYGVFSCKFAMGGLTPCESGVIWNSFLQKKKSVFIFTDLVLGYYNVPPQLMRPEISQNWKNMNFIRFTKNFNPNDWKLIFSRFFQEYGFPDRDEISTFYRQSTFSKKELAKYVSVKGRPKDIKMDMTLIVNNFNQNIVPCLEKSRNASVIFFFPPYSILTYEQSLNAHLEFKKRLVKLLSDYPQVKIYDFQSEPHLVKNLNIYMDYSHYNEKVNTWIIQNTLHDRYRITSENLDIFLDSHRKMVENYDFEAAFHELDKIYRQEIKPDL